MSFSRTLGDAYLSSERPSITLQEAFLRAASPDLIQDAVNFAKSLPRSTLRPLLERFVELKEGKPSKEDLEAFLPAWARHADFSDLCFIMKDFTFAKALLSALHNNPGPRFRVARTFWEGGVAYSDPENPAVLTAQEKSELLKIILSSSSRSQIFNRNDLYILRTLVITQEDSLRLLEVSKGPAALLNIEWRLSAVFRDALFKHLKSLKPNAASAAVWDAALKFYASYGVSQKDLVFFKTRYPDSALTSAVTRVEKALFAGLKPFPEDGVRFQPENSKVLTTEADQRRFALSFCSTEKEILSQLGANLEDLLSPSSLEEAFELNISDEGVKTFNQTPEIFQLNRWLKTQEAVSSEFAAWLLVWALPAFPKLREDAASSQGEAQLADRQASSGYAAHASQEALKFFREASSSFAPYSSLATMLLSKADPRAIYNACPGLLQVFALFLPRIKIPAEELAHKVGFLPFKTLVADSADRAPLLEVLFEANEGRADVVESLFDSFVGTLDEFLEVIRSFAPSAP